MGEPRSAGARAAAHPPSSLDAATLRLALAAGADALAREAEAINAINVFPVPDGDTGTNMHLTMRASIEEPGEAVTAAAILAATARGALMGAKGNSGVILSQILRGLADGAAGAATLDARTLAEGLQRGREAAYRVVSVPKEGTILTAVTAAAEAALAASASGADATGALDAATAAARDAVARTPDLLPVLKEAGVVDAGAQGLYVLLDGILRHLTGEAPAAGAVDLGAIDPEWLAARQHVHDNEERAGFCTEFVVTGDALDAEAARAHLAPLGNSLLVVGNGERLRIHLHTKAPDDAIAYGRSLGAVSHEKVEDMDAQVRALARARGAPPRAEGMAVVAVAAGAGLEALFISMGATIVHGGQTMNPSAGEIREAIAATGAADVIVLPNNKNVVMSARQAAEGLPGRIRVIETRSVPQGVAALVAMNTEEPFEENVAAMQSAISGIRTAEVTHAARATRIHGLEIRQGQPIGLVDGDLVVAEETIAEAVIACVRRMLDRGGALVTLYAGEGEREDAAEAIAGRLRAELGVEVEVVEGGQPHYPYFVSVE